VGFLFPVLKHRNHRWIHDARLTLALALPIMAGLAGQMLMTLADTLMVGRVGTVPLAAAALGHSLSHLPMVAGFGLLTAVAVLTAHAYGAKRAGVAGEVLRHGLWIALATGVGAALMIWFFRSRLGWLKQPSEVVSAAQTYLLLVGWSTAPALVAHALKQFSEALARPWPPMFILLGGVLLNIFLNWLFIYGHWGIPAMGVNGAGWATLLARAATAAGMIAYLLSSPHLKVYLPRAWMAPWSRGAFSEQLALGSPVAAQHLLEVGAFVTAALMMGWISAEAIAAHQIAITCAATTFVLSLGIGMAVSIRVGHAWGARAYQRLRRVGQGGFAMTLMLMSCFAALFLLGGRQIASMFTPSPEVVMLAGSMLVVAGLFQVFDGLQVVAISALRGMADVRVPAILAGISYWGVALPLGCVLGFGLGWGAVGIWIGLAAGLATAAVVLIWRFVRSSSPSVKPKPTGCLSEIGTA
jgi:MATE family multidrug resistance protein